MKEVFGVLIAVLCLGGVAFGLIEAVKGDLKRRRELARCLKHQMTSAEAMEIVLSLAAENLVGADETSEEYVRQLEAINHVGDLIGTKYTNHFEPWVPGVTCQPKCPLERDIRPATDFISHQGNPR